MVYLIYYKIGYNWLKKYEKRWIEYTIYTRSHMLKKYICDMKNCETSFEKIYLYIMVIYINCKGIYQVISDKYLVRQKAKKKQRKRKVIKAKKISVIYL